MFSCCIKQDPNNCEEAAKQRKNTHKESQTKIVINNENN